MSKLLLEEIRHEEDVLWLENYYAAKKWPLHINFVHFNDIYRRVTKRHVSLHRKDAVSYKKLIKDLAVIKKRGLKWIQ